MPMSRKTEKNHKENQSTSYGHVLRYTGIFGGAQGLKLMMSVVRNKLTAILLGSMGIGLISVYNSISEFIINCCNFGIPLNATRMSGELYDNATQKQIEHFVAVIRTWILGSSILAVIICTLFSPLLSFAFFNKEWNHFTDIMMVIPIVVCLLIAEGECSILKGLRQLRKIAIIEVLSAILVVIVTIPFYYLFGIRGVIMGLIGGGLVAAVLHLYFSTRLIPYRILPFDRNTFREGLPMIQKGIPYILAGVVNSIVVMSIPMIILMQGTMNDVGYFRAGYAIMVGYAGLGFVALEADYFPRLSSACHETERMNTTINQQIDVCVLFLTPMLILLCMFIQTVLGLLYDTEFVIINGMALCAAFYTFFRCISLPLGYIFLARGEAITYLILEVLYDVFYTATVYFLFMHMGLLGIGISLSLGALYDMTLFLYLTHRKYKTKIYNNVKCTCAFQFMMLLTTVICCLQCEGSIRYIICSLCLVLSLAYSLLYYVKRKK